MANPFTVKYTFECPHCKQHNEGKVKVLASSEIEARNKIYPVKCSKCGKDCAPDNPLTAGVKKIRGGQ